MVLPDEHVVRPCPSTNSQRLPSPALPTAGGCFVSTCLTQHKHEKMTLLHLHLPSPFVAQRHEIAVTTVQSSDDAPRMLNSVSDQSLATNPTSMITQGSNLSRNLQKKKKSKEAKRGIDIQVAAAGGFMSTSCFICIRYYQGSMGKESIQPTRHNNKRV